MKDLYGLTFSAFYPDQRSPKLSLADALVLPLALPEVTAPAVLENPQSRRSLAFS